MQIELIRVAPDILHAILAEWLTVPDLVRLDTAFCQRDARLQLMNILKDPGFFVNYDADNTHFMKWITARGIRASQLHFSDVPSFQEYLRSIRKYNAIGDPLLAVSFLSIDNLHNENVVQIATEIPSALKLSALGLRSCTSNEAIRQVLGALPQSCHLDSLDLYNFHDYLCSSISSSPMVQQNLRFLQKLDLSFTNFDSKGDWLTTPKLLPLLHTLCLNQCFPATNFFITNIVACYGQQLTRLEINFCEELGDIAMNSIVDNCKVLQHLEVSGSNRMTVESLQRLSSTPFSLSSLNISQHWSISNDILKAIISHMAFSPNSEIHMLNLARNISGTDDTLLIFLAEHAAELQRLDVSYCFKISDAGLLSLAMCCPGLRAINLSYCNKLTDFSIKMLVTHCSQLEELHLMMCLNITDEIVILIAEMCQMLKQLNVSGCAKLTDAGLWGLGAGTTRHTLTHFEIADNANITFSAILHFVQQCRSLQKLNVVHCEQVSSRNLAVLEERYKHRLELLEMRGYSQIVLAAEQSS
jgi:hypothetical protein